MSFTNINDPAGVQALLDQLRTSQAWQNLVNTQLEAQAQPAPQPASAPSASETAPGSTSTSVAALLSQLNSVPDVSHTTEVSPSPTKDPLLPPPPAPEPAPYAFTEDVRSLTFQQALPRLAQLSDSAVVVSTIEKLKQEQDKIEQELWQERTAIRIKYEERVKVARTKATMIGTGLSKHEAEMLSHAYEKELKRFDAERVLPAWDGLVTSQQAALAQLKVPTMFPTAVKTDRERQQRVIQVLEGIVGPGGA